ncbi:Lysosomal Pro-X carboxypeptidase, partial [Ophiophagus hannah]
AFSLQYKHLKHRRLFFTELFKKKTLTILAPFQGFMWNVAEELDAILVFAEHRYYGESLPFGNKSYTDAKHLNYLSSQQALADFAVLIQHLKNTIPGTENTPVIAIGGSYGGMLAAWFRMKYPHIIVTEDFKKSGIGCSETIKNSWAAIKRIADTDVINFREWLRGTWIYVAMVDYPYEAAFLQPLPAWPVKVICKYLKNPKLPDRLLLQNIFQAVNIYYNYTGHASCLNLTQTTTKSLGLRGWSYQACTEMVMPMCSDSINDMFEPQKWDFHAYSEECFKAWGVRPRPSWIPTFYVCHSHLSSPFSASNGGLDPWSGGGVTKNITDTLVAIMIPEGAHHLDLRSNNPFDPISVLQARLLEVHYMKLWLQKHKR